MPYIVRRTCASDLLWIGAVATRLSMSLFCHSKHVSLLRTGARFSGCACAAVTWLATRHTSSQCHDAMVFPPKTSAAAARAATLPSPSDLQVL